MVRVACSVEPIKCSTSALVVARDAVNSSLYSNTVLAKVRTKLLTKKEKKQVIKTL